MTDRTFEAVQRQVHAMATHVFEVGLFKPMPEGSARQAEMLTRTWDLDTLMKSIPWLKFQNRDGRNIYIRPKGEHAAPGVADVIGSRVGVATAVGDPLGQMKISGRAKSQGVDRDATALLTACGLALRSFD